MTKIAIVSVTLVLAMLMGLSLRPDDGTPYSARPIDAASMAVGTSHAKPLPRIPSVTDLLGTSVAIVAALVLAAATAWVRRLAHEQRADLRSDLVRSMARVRRGPPALA